MTDQTKPRRMPPLTRLQQRVLVAMVPGPGTLPTITANAGLRSVPKPYAANRLVHKCLLSLQRRGLVSRKQSAPGARDSIWELTLEGKRTILFLVEKREIRKARYTTPVQEIQT